VYVYFAVKERISTRRIVEASRLGRYLESPDYYDALAENFVIELSQRKGPCPNW